MLDYHIYDKLILSLTYVFLFYLKENFDETNL